MTPELFKILKSIDTPTVCNAIEIAQGGRGFNGFTRGTVMCSNSNAGSIVGYARTAQIAAVSPPTESTDVIKTRRMQYYRHMSVTRDSSFTVPNIAVVEDIDFPNCIGAYWGEINANVHKALGLAGALTNGVMRDLADIPNDFAVIAGSIGPSHGFVHVKTVGEGACIFGLVVKDNDLIHADLHGAVVIPEIIVKDLHEAIKKLLETEQIILKPSKGKKMTFEDFEKVWDQFEKARV